jgi:chemotaxis protein histidine kinase CheA
MRVVSIDSVFSRLPRAARGLAKELGKKVELSLEGGEVRIDKSIVDRLTDPLMHMVRNSIDHGVEPPALRQSSGKPETAQLRISASQEGPEVLIVVADDGRGIDTDSVLRRAIERGLVASHEVESLSPELIYGFIFTPGFSTASVVTETSGRGVGMDVVLNTVRELGGSIHTASDRGRGTRFTIRLPLSAAMQGISRVEVSGERFGINDRFVSRVGLVSRDSLRVVGKHRQATLRGHSLIFASLAEILWGEVEAQAEAATDPQPVIVLRWGEQEVALAVDRLLGRRTVFIRELHPMLSLVPFLSGTTIEGDGTILMVLDGGALLASAVEADDHRSKLQQHAVG